MSNLRDLIIRTRGSLARTNGAQIRWLWARACGYTHSYLGIQVLNALKSSSFHSRAATRWALGPRVCSPSRGTRSIITLERRRCRRLFELSTSAIRYHVVFIFSYALYNCTLNPWNFLNTIIIEFHYTIMWLWSLSVLNMSLFYFILEKSINISELHTSAAGLGARRKTHHFPSKFSFLLLRLNLRLANVNINIRRITSHHSRWWEFHFIFLYFSCFFSHLISW